MAGYRLIEKIRRIEAISDRLGLKLASPRVFVGTYNQTDTLALIPKDKDSLPLYTRDAELFCGTLEEVENWITGVLWARDYDRMLFGKGHEAKRERKEQDCRNRKLVDILTKEEKVD